MTGLTADTPANPDDESDRIGLHTRETKYASKGFTHLKSKGTERYEDMTVDMLQRMHQCAGLRVAETRKPAYFIKGCFS